MNQTSTNHKISIAPMMDYTDRHFRYFMRLISPSSLLYTEMITAEAILRGDRSRLLDYDASEHPLVLQLGGSDPARLAEAAKIAADLGYDEVNINIGCPSSRVQKGKIGVCLMLEADLVASCFAAMQTAVDIPVTIKTRIGVDNEESYEFLSGFIEKQIAGGCKDFIIHARKAWLKGLSPKQNRDRPPLNYDHVYRLKQDFPALNLSINGGIKNIEDIKSHLNNVDGVMVGREAYSRPMLFAEIEKQIFNNDNLLSEAEILQRYAAYIEAQLELGVNLKVLLKPVLNIYKGKPGARIWRRKMAEVRDIKTLSELVEL